MNFSNQQKKLENQYEYIKVLKKAVQLNEITKKLMWMNNLLVDVYVIINL